MIDLFGITRRRLRRLEDQWEHEVRVYRESGGMANPDTPDPFLMTMADPQEQMWRREFMSQFDSGTGEYEANWLYPTERQVRMARESYQGSSR